MVKWKALLSPGAYSIFVLGRGFLSSITTVWNTHSAALLDASSFTSAPANVIAGGIW